MEHSTEQHGTAGFKTYVITWAALVILAAASVAVTHYHMGALNLLVALVIASVKAGLILYIFMHLGYEGWFFRLAFLLPIAVFAFIIGFTFLDVLFR